MTTLLIVFLFVPITIFAQEEPPRGKSVREQVKAKITEKRLEIRDRVAEVKKDSHIGLMFITQDFQK